LAVCPAMNLAATGILAVFIFAGIVVLCATLGGKK
jgi:hypothetical protein